MDAARAGPGPEYLAMQGVRSVRQNWGTLLGAQADQAEQIRMLRWWDALEAAGAEKRVEDSMVIMRLLRAGVEGGGGILGFGLRRYRGTGLVRGLRSASP
jgi:hypothetical protein